jgi:polysaccharide deacetylase family protein (PEP-CTERM system associated)
MIAGPQLSCAPLHALTVDVEDWPQSTLDHSLAITDRAVRNTHRLLELFAQHNVRGTFFVLGLLAERFHQLVAEIAAGGHEVATHGYSHRPVFQIGQKAFRSELVNSVKLLEDITGRRVEGYRAPDFSITEQSLWALDILAEEKLTYDSSVFPMRLPRYGVDGVPRGIHRLVNGLIEVPLSTVQWARRSWPVAGGGYFRLYPYSLTRLAIRSLEAERLPAVVYLHPYEIDPTELREIPCRVPLRLRITQSIGRRRVADRLARLFRDFRFGPISEVLNSVPAFPAGTMPPGQRNAPYTLNFITST